MMAAGTPIFKFLTPSPSAAITPTACSTGGLKLRQANSGVQKNIHNEESMEVLQFKELN